MEKYIKDGQVAVLYSPGHGAGWSTWNWQDCPQMIYDPKIVQMLLDHPEGCIVKLLDYSKEAYPNAYLGGADDLTIEWLPIGTEFLINEFDGSESIQLKEKTPWLIA